MEPRERKVVLINPSRLYSDGWSTGAEIGRNNPALQILKGAVQDLVDVEILDLPNVLGVPESDAAREVFLASSGELLGGRDWGHTLVGISCWSSLHYLSTLHVARIIKKAGPTTRIVVGGYHPSSVPGDFLEFPDLFDHVVIGPGEGPLKRLLTTGTTERVLRARPRTGPPKELLTQTPPTRPTDVHYLYLSRGCPFACTYCVESVMTQRQWRALSPTKAANLVLAIDRSGLARRIGICDPCFGAIPKWRHAFLRKLVKAGLKTPIWVETRAETFTEEDVDLLSQLPCKVDFGLDSGSETILRIMRKTSNPRRYLDRTAAVTRELDHRGVPVNLYLIFNHPGETEFTIRETVAYLSTLRSGLTQNKARFSSGTYFFVPGTAVEEELDQLAAAYGTVVREKTWWKKPQPHYPLAINIQATSGRPGSEIHGEHWRRVMDRLAQPQGAWRFVR